MKQAPGRVGAWLANTFHRLWGALRRRPGVALAAVLVAIPSLAVLYVAALVPLTPSMESVKKTREEYPSVVMTADGKELATFRRANREWVPLSGISPHVLSALIATEDRRFFEHGGLDLRRTVSAALRTMGGDTQGGSTVTQQLARNLYPQEIGRATTLTRKIKEAITALKIESVYTKEEILETYLNTVPFLYNAYGIEMAARTYFDKSAGQLDELESATLIGMLKGTSYYNPVLNPERAVQRRNTVLAQMAKYGQLAPARLDALKARPLGLDFERQQEDLGPAPHLAQQLRRWLISWADRNGYNVHADGLVVRTTIDSRMQAMATQALTRQADKLQAIADGAWGKRANAPANREMLQAFVRESAPYREARDAGLDDAQALKKVMADSEFMQALWKEKITLQAGFLAQEPANGHVKAWVGSRDFKQDQFDHVQQARRQPGSTFKPFVYGAAFEQGVPPSETLIDQVTEFRIDERTVWRPGDVQPPTGLPMTLREGLIQSKNTITAQVMQKVGAPRVAKVARDMGVRQSKLDAVPALALGTSPVTLKEMVSAYGTIVNSGSYIEPVLVTAVENRQGQVLEAFHARAPEQGLASAAAQTLLDVLRGVIDQGTGAGIRSRFGVQGDVAGKTGTTQDNTDGWFILMHPQLVAGAWVGFNDNRITMGDSWGQGAHNALNIVGDFFQQAQKARVVDTRATFAAPRDPGMLDRVNDWFNSVWQNSPEAQQLPQPAVVTEPPVIVQPLPSEQSVVTVPGPAMEPPPARPEFQWTPERESAGPPAVRPELPASPVTEYRIEPRPPSSGDGAGVRILREVRP
ncbi:MAG TPA: transglycosylase domain-containing protein [Ramlibacter sp.]|nr:transglycosylase domain-containing protein [Ramlibacter sp.]